MLLINCVVIKIPKEIMRFIIQFIKRERERERNLQFINDSIMCSVQQTTPLIKSVALHTFLDQTNLTLCGHLKK